MGQLLPFFRPEKVFDSDTAALLVAACDKAASGIAEGVEAGIMREVTARRIITLAARGEREPERLCASARLMLSRTRGAVPIVQALPPRG
jgi:hypothetical protein